MEDPSSYLPSREEARAKLGLDGPGEEAKVVAHWQEVERGLKKKIKAEADVNVRAAYEEDLKSLQNSIAAAGLVKEAKLELKDRNEPEKGPRSNFPVGMLVWALMVALLAGAGFWGYKSLAVHDPGSEKNLLKAEIEESRKNLEMALAASQWKVAEGEAKILQDAGEDVGQSLQSIREGREAELAEKIAFLVGNIESRLESDQVDQAEGFLKKIEELSPEYSELDSMRLKISSKREQLERAEVLSAINQSLEQENWGILREKLSQFSAKNPGDRRLAGFRKRLEMGEKQSKAEQKLASKLLTMARDLDQGVFSAQALSLITEAVRLNPTPEARDLFDKISAYGRVIRVPGDAATIAQALEGLRPKDQVILGNGTYRESITIPDGVELSGVSRKEVILECDANVGPVVTIGKSQTNHEVRISGITLRHGSIEMGEKRFPVVAVDGGSLKMENVTVSRASGHGIAILNGGQAKLKNCLVQESGWDGISVAGSDSKVMLTEVKSERNLHHGVDFWEGGSGQVIESEMSKNGRAGIAAIGSDKPVVIRNSQASGNLELGMFFSEASGVDLANNQIRDNSLGGVVFEHGCRGVSIQANLIEGNGEVGLVTERGVEITSETENRITGNKGRNRWADAVFPAPPETETPPPPPPAKISNESR